MVGARSGLSEDEQKFFNQMKDEDAKKAVRLCMDQSGGSVVGEGDLKIDKAEANLFFAKGA